MNKETIKEVLELLKDYSGWMYYNPKAEEMLENHSFDMDGYKCHLSILPDGLIQISIENFPDIKATYDCRISTCPLIKGKGIDNIKYDLRMVTPKEEIPEDFHEFFDKVGMFALSYFQRAACFMFFCRMAPESIDLMASDLSKIGPKENE